MRSQITAGYFWFWMAVCVLGLSGCGPRTHSKSAGSAASHSGPTIDQVCGVVAKQLGVDRSKLNANTSLGELGADDLDFVELVMELEEHFGITIPDDAFEPTMGTDKGQGQLRNVTIAKLAALVAERTGQNAQSVQGPAPAAGSVSGEQKSPSIR